MHGNGKNKEKDTRVVSRAPKWAEWMIRFRLTMLILILLITGIFCYGVSTMSVMVILEDMFPFGHPFVRLHKEFGSQFGGASTVLTALKVKDGDIFNPEFLKKVKEVSDFFVFRDDLYPLLTTSIAERKTKYMRGHAGGNIEMDGLMWPRLPKTEEEIEFLKENIFTNPLYNGVLVSKDEKATLILSEFKEAIDYTQLFQDLMAMKEKYEDENTSIHMIGKPVLLGWIYSYRPQMMIIFALSIVILMGFLFIFFRVWQGMVIPATTAIFSALWGLGILGFVQVNLSPLLFVLVFLVGARALGQSVQMSQRYFEELNISGGDRKKAAAQTMGALLIPGLTAILTDMAGFAVCYLIKIILMQQLAIALTIWMGTIFILTGIFTPIFCSYLPSPMGKFLEKIREEEALKEKPGLMDRINLRLAALAMGKGGLVIIGIYIVLFLFSASRIPKVAIGDTTPGSSILWPDSVYNQDYNTINETFDKAGADTYLVFFRGKEEFASKDPEVIKTLEALERHMASHLPDIYGGSSSVTTIVSKLNRELHDTSPRWEFVPDDSALVAAMLFMFQSKCVPGDFDRFADPKFYNANTLLFFKDHTEKTIERIREEVKAFFKKHPMKIDSGEFLLAGGVIGMETAVNEEIAGLHAKVDALVLGAIFVMCSLAYRSLLAGVLLCLPLLLANLVCFAYMAYANIGFTINTLPCSAVGVGVGVDFSLFIFSRVREEMGRRNGDWDDSIKVTARTATKGVVYTALSLILPCLVWYFVSGLKFQAQMGLLLSILLCFNMISALVLHPALLYRIKPGFIYKAKIKKGGE